MSASYTPNTSIQPPPQGLAPGELVPVKAGEVQTERERRAKIEESRQTAFVDLDEYLVNVCRKIESINAETELDRLRLILKMRKFYAGHQIGLVSKRTNQWVDKKKPGDALYVDPVLASFVDTNIATRMKSRPKIKISARASDRVDKQEAAKYAQELHEDAVRELFTASVRERENKNLELSGETYGHLYFNPHAEGTEIKVPMTERRSVLPQTRVWECDACDETGKLDGTSEEDRAIQGQFAAGVTTCPKCGYGKARLVAAEAFESEVITGYRDVPAGDVCFVQPDPLTVKVIGSGYKIKDALAVTWDSLIMRGVLEEHYKDVEIPASGTVPLRLQYAQDLREQTGSAGSAYEEGEGITREGGEQFELLHFKRVWLSPALYGGYVFQKQARLPNGRVIERGTTLRSLFPRGLYYCKVGSKVLDIYEQSIGSCWSHCQNITGDGFHGIGQWDLLPMQEMINELVSLQFANEMQDSVTNLLVRQQYIEGGKMPNKPGAVVPVTNLDEQYPLSHVVSRVPPNNHTSGAQVLREQLMGSGQMRSGSFSPSGGAPDVKAAGTATGIAIIQEQSVGRMGPSLALQAEMEVDRAFQILELRQQNWPEEMYQTLDKKVGGDAGKWFRESDIRRDFRIEVVPQSWWPQSEAQRRIDFGEMVNLARTLGVQSPELVEQLFKRGGELYGRGIELEIYQNDRVEARIRLERMRQIADFLERKSGVPVYDASGSPAESMVDLALERADLIPEMPGKPTNAILDRHDEYVSSYSNWLLTSEGRDASPFVRAVVNKCISEHYDGKLEQAQYFEGLKAKAQIPQKMADVVSREVDAEQQRGIQEEEAARQMQTGQQERELQAVTGAAAQGAIPLEEAVAMRDAVLAEN